MFWSVMSFSLLFCVSVTLKSFVASIILIFTAKKQKKSWSNHPFMSLDNIQLPAATIAALYKKSLVELKTAPAKENNATTSSINILGKNAKGVVIIVSNTDTAYLPDDELNFLLGILNACKLNMDDVGIFNLQKNEGVDYKTITSSLKAEKIFLFGTGAEEIKLPLSFPAYQIQQYNNQVYLTAPALSALQTDKAEKTKLWNCLKQIFSI
jgi:hypothetical protein